MLRFLCIGMFAGLCLLNGAGASERMAQLCAQHVEQTVQRATLAATEETRECVRRIVALKEQGQHDEALRLARECMQRATNRTEKAVEYVTQICNRCIAALLAHDEPELARRIDRLCSEAIATLRSLLQRQRNAIHDALH